MEFINEFWDLAFTNLISGDIAEIDEITGIRVLNNTKTHQTLRFEVWLKCGLEFYRGKDQATFELNSKKIDRIRESVSQMFPKAFNVSVRDFAFKDIYK